jgi:hypothetical protein
MKPRKISPVRIFAQSIGTARVLRLLLFLAASDKTQAGQYGDFYYVETDTTVTIVKHSVAGDVVTIPESKSKHKITNFLLAPDVMVSGM